MKNHSAVSFNHCDLAFKPPDIYSREVSTSVHLEISARMYIVPFFIIASKLATTQMPIRRIRDVSVEIYSYSGQLHSIKLLIHTTAWMSVIEILVSKKHETQKTVYCMISFICNSQAGQLITKIRVLIISGEWILIGKGQKGTFWDTGNVLCLPWVAITWILGLYKKFKIGVLFICMFYLSKTEKKWA